MTLKSGWATQLAAGALGGALWHGGMPSGANCTAFEELNCRLLFFCFSLFLKSSAAWNIYIYICIYERATVQLFVATISFA